MNRLLSSLCGMFLIACGGGSTVPTALQPGNVPPPTSIDDEAVFLGDFDGLGVEELFVARLDGTSVRKVSHPLASSEDVLQYHLSPDQKYAAYVSGAAERGDFYIVRLADLQSVKLPLVSVAGWPQICWAPDGSRLGIKFTETTTPSFSNQLYTVRRDGTGLARLSVPTLSVTGGMNWSPDSKRILYKTLPSGAGSVEAFVATADGTSSQRVTPPMTAESRFEGAAFAPNSSRVAVIVQVADNSEYRPYTTRVPGGIATVLTPSTGERADLRDGAWSPDSSRLTYLTDAGRPRGRYVLRITDGTGPGINRRISHALASDDTVDRHRWSPDGKWIAYEATNGAKEELWITDLDGNAAQFSPAGSANAIVREWRWSPDARWIAFQIDNNRDTFADLYLWEVGTGGAATMIASGTVGTEPPSWSPTSERFAFRASDGQISTVAVAAPMDVVRISDNAAGTHLSRASCREHFAAEWSADGKTVVYLETFGHTGARLVARASDASTPAVDMSGLTQQFITIRGYMYRSIRFPRSSMR